MAASNSGITRSAVNAIRGSASGKATNVTNPRPVTNDMISSSSSIYESRSEVGDMRYS
jgi:hypothetical protein